jgi:hypothetical protein
MDPAMLWVAGVTDAAPLHQLSMHMCMCVCVCVCACVCVCGLIWWNKQLAYKDIKLTHWLIMSARIVQPMILQHQLITSQLVIELCAFSNRYPPFYIKISKITAQFLRNQNMQKILIPQPKWCTQLSSYETLVTQSTSMWCQHPKEGSTLSFHGNYLSESVMFILIRKLWLDCFAMTSIASYTAQQDLCYCGYCTDTKCVNLLRSL